MEDEPDAAGADDSARRLGGVKRRFSGGQAYEFHPQGIEHVLHHHLFIRREIASSFFFQHRKQVNNLLGLR
jgi:hypothetical protein